MERANLGEIIFKASVGLAGLVLLGVVVVYRAPIWEVLSVVLVEGAQLIAEDALIGLITLGLVGLGIAVAWAVRKGMRWSGVESAPELDLHTIFIATTVVTAFVSVVLKVGFGLDWIGWDWIVGVGLAALIIYAIERF